MQAGLKRTGIGVKVKTRVQHEAAQARALEGTPDRLGLFQLHHVDWIHTGTPQRDTGTLKAGQPDYFIIGDGWSAWLEIKARDPVTRRIGRLQANQRSFHDKLRNAGHEVWTVWLPDDLEKVNLWLRSKTGIVVELEL